MTDYDWSEVLRLAIGFSLLWSGIAKLRAQASFAQSLVELQLTRSSHAHALAVSVAGLEVVAATLSFTPGTQWLGALVAATLFLAFVGVVGVTLARGSRASCHCYGPTTS